MQAHQRPVASEAMHEFIFSIEHEGCWTADVATAFPEFEAKILESSAYSATSQTVVQTRYAREENARAVLEWLDDHPVVDGTDLFRPEGAPWLVALETDFEGHETAPLSVVYRSHPVMSSTAVKVADGVEHHSVVLPTEAGVQAMYEELREYGAVQMRMINRVDSIEAHTAALSAVGSAIDALSPRQREVLKRAITNGYYDVPKGCDVDELAEMDASSMSTVAEHLRNAEHKIFQGLLSLLEDVDPADS